MKGESKKEKSGFLEKTSVGERMLGGEEGTEVPLKTCVSGKCSLSADVLMQRFFNSSFG